MSTRASRLVETLVPQASGLRLDHFLIRPTTITVSLSSPAPTAPCPQCAQHGSRIRGSYVRTLADLPWGAVVVRLEVHVRKFACDVSHCPQRIFTERLPALTTPYARRTARLTELVRTIAFAVGGEAGSRLLDRLRLPASAATLLRLTRSTSLPTFPTPHVLSVDDWARRKGQTYGTILVDLERHQPIDLLPDRTASTFAAWLREHPGVKIISRDRAGAYAEGATTGAPDALQVADRWHVLHNLSDALERVLQEHGAAIRRSFTASVSMTPSDAAPVVPAELRGAALTQRQQLGMQQRRTARLERYATVKELHERGLSLQAIAEQVGLSRKTVQRFVHKAVFPERRSRPARPSHLDPYKAYLLTRWNAGCHNSVRLLEEIRVQGYSGGRTMVRDFLAQFRRHHLTMATTTNTAQPLSAVLQERPPAVRQLVWYVLRRPETLKEEEQRAVTQLCLVHPEVEQAVQFAQEFAVMVRQRHPSQLEPWLWRVANSEVAALRSFAAGIQRDKAAVRAGLTLEWSQGQTEGQVTRLKLLKRAMYGRANTDLLRQRMLNAA